MLEVIQHEPGTAPGTHQRVEALRELVVTCPTFAPALLALSRAMLLNKHGADDSQAYFAEIEHTLHDAVDVSGEDPSALIELGHFTDVVRDAPSEAEPLFAQAAQRALNLLEEAWAGQISVLGQQDKLHAALEVAALAGKILPGSVRIREAVEFARQSASHQ